jgi:hypothetical protein
MFDNAKPAARIVAAARLILSHLERGSRIDARNLRAAMESAFAGSDAGGAWDWKTAYDACEAATVLFVRRFGPAMRGGALSPSAMLPMLAKIAGLLPTHTRRSQESEALQQFSAPIGLEGRETADRFEPIVASAMGRTGASIDPATIARRLLERTILRGYRLVAGIQSSRASLRWRKEK